MSEERCGRTPHTVFFSLDAPWEGQGFCPVKSHLGCPVISGLGISHAPLREEPGWPTFPAWPEKHGSSQILVGLTDWRGLAA